MAETQVNKLRVRTRDQGSKVRKTNAGGISYDSTSARHGLWKHLSEIVCRQELIIEETVCNPLN